MPYVYDTAAQFEFVDKLKAEIERSCEVRSAALAAAFKEALDRHDDLLIGALRKIMG